MSVLTPNYFVPKSLPEALKIAHRMKVTPLAGGTDLIARLNAGESVLGGAILSLRHLCELGKIEQREGEIEIGARTTITEILESSLLKSKVKVLCETAQCFAGEQIRNAATLGGNLCNASPAADMAIPLLLLDAQIELARWGEGVERRQIPLSQFFLGPRKVAKDEDEIVTRVIFSVPKDQQVIYFEKFGTRESMDISVVSVGFSANLNGDQLSDVRVALGAVAPTPIRQRSLEGLLENCKIKNLDEKLPFVREILGREVRPISDVRASAWYRGELLYKLLKRVFADVVRKRD